MDIFLNLPKEVKLNKLFISMKALVALEYIHTKFEQNPMKTQEEISIDFQGGQWRPDTGQWTKKDTNSSLEWRSKWPNITSLVLK